MAFTPFWDQGETITFADGEQYLATFDWSTIPPQYTQQYFDLRNNTWQNPNSPGYVGVRQLGGGAVFFYTATFDGYVTFRALPSDITQGVTLELYKPFLLPGNSNVQGWADAFFGFNVASCTRYVQTGEFYALSVTGGGTETITFTAEQTPGEPSNNSFDSPTFITIAENGGVYDAEPVLNDFLTNGPDDPPGTFIYRTAWWTYSSPNAGQVTYTIGADPEADTTIRATIWAYNGNNEIYQVGSMSVGTSWTETVPADSPRHIQMGSASTNQRNTRGVYYHLTVVGQRTHAQAEPAPVNDLRVHATTVDILNDGETFTSVATDNTFATNDNSTGVDDPTTEGLYKTVWWKYVPRVSGTYSVDLTVAPESDDVVLEEWRVNSSGVLYPSNTAVTSAGYAGFTSEIHHDVEPNTIRFYVIGTLTETTTGLRYTLRINGPITVDPPTDPDPVPPYTPPVTPWDPNAPNVPVVDPSTAKASLLSLIREFSGKIRRAVRVLDAGVTPAIGSTPAQPWANISLVDPAAANRLQTADPATLYRTAVDEAKMGNTRKLKVINGPITQSASAVFITNDASVLVSGWRIPDALPLPGVNGGSTDNQPVRSVRMTFTIDAFQCDIEFHPIY